MKDDDRLLYLYQDMYNLARDKTRLCIKRRSNAHQAHIERTPSPHEVCVPCVFVVKLFSV
jgi:hypothetical protein